MTDIDPKEYLTIPEVQKRLKMPRRSLYRILDRLGDKASSLVFGRRVIHVTMLPAIKAEHMPFGSKKRLEMCRASGHKGGTQKGINANRRRSSSSGKTGTATGGRKAE